MKSNHLNALAVGATAGIALLALLSLLRADSMRRAVAETERRDSARRQVDRWDAEGGSVLPDGEDDDTRESGPAHA